MMTAPETAEEHARKVFASVTGENEMTVLHDDGLYRHVRFARPGTSLYSYSLVTWPGYLAISGDCESFVFRRVPDMFEFFEHMAPDQINPCYWAEKLAAPCNGSVKTYSHERLHAKVREWFDAVSVSMPAERRDGLRRALHEQILGDEDVEYSEDAARIALRDFEHDELWIDGTSDWQLRDWDHHFLYACWAIRTGIERYRAAAPAPDTGETDER